MSNLNESQDVSVIGTGEMGTALAQRLLAGGHRVAVWNRTAAKCGPLAKVGASVAGSVTEAALAARVVVVCVIDHDASLAVLRSDAVAEALRGKLLVQLSTVSAEESRTLGRWADDRGIAYLDGSILAYSDQMRGNDCTIVYSGPRNVFDASKDVLASMGGDPRLVGEAAGGAPTFDKAIYACHYGSMLAFLHGAAICHKAGFPIETYIDQVVEVEDMRRRFGAMIEKRSYDSQGGDIEGEAVAYDHVVKLDVVLGIDPTFSQTVASYFARGMAEGRGKQEIAAIFELMIEKAG